MKDTLHVVAAAALMCVVIAMPALADGPRTHSGNMVSQGSTQPPGGATMTSPHYEWQYHYVGHNARFVGYWALVK